MESKKIIIILTIAIILVLILVAFKTTERIIEDKKQKELAGNNDNDKNNQGLPTLKPGASESSGGSEGGTRGAESIENRTDLPSDINTRPCSSYFEEYSVCAGTCPSGTCTQEGQSCYCK